MNQIAEEAQDSCAIHLFRFFLLVRKVEVTSDDIWFILKRLMLICAKSQFLQYIYLIKLKEKIAFRINYKNLNQCAYSQDAAATTINSSKLKLNVKKTLFSYSILNILQFGGNISAPNLKWRV